MASPCKSSSSSSTEDGIELRRGPWTVEEDSLLIHYIASHGEGRWNLLAKTSGLRRTGKSCRLRWLNYLKPDVKRGNLSPEEQLLILQLHSKWGNRWSKIAQFLPGRTDNEIKNYWRTRVQKQARHLKVDSNSAAFQQLIRRFWMPCLIQKIQSNSPIQLTQSPAIATPQDNSCSIPNLNSPDESMRCGQNFFKVSEWPKTEPGFDSCNPNGHQQFDNNVMMDDGFSPFSEIGEFKDVNVIDYDDQLGGGGNCLMDDFLDDSLWNMDKF